MNITSVGRSLSVMDSTLTIITRDLGIHNAALTDTLRAFQVVADAVRFAGAAQRLYQMAVDMTTASQVANDAAVDAGSISGLTNTAVVEGQTAAEWGLFAALEAVNAAMGPIGWLALAGGLITAGAIGYGLAGGFGGGGAPATSAGAVGETTNIYIGSANMQTSRDAAATANMLATLYHQQRRNYGR